MHYSRNIILRMYKSQVMPQLAASSYGVPKLKHVTTEEIVELLMIWGYTNLKYPNSEETLKSVAKIFLVKGKQNDNTLHYPVI